MQDSNDVRNISIWLGSFQQNCVHSLEESFNSCSDVIALLKDLLNKCVHACLFVSHPISYRIVSYRFTVFSLQSSTLWLFCFVSADFVLKTNFEFTNVIWVALTLLCAHCTSQICAMFKLLAQSTLTYTDEQAHTHSVCEVQANEIVLGTTEFETVCICERTWPQMLRLNIESLKLIISPKYGRKRHHPSMSGPSCLNWQL